MELLQQIENDNDEGSNSVSNDLKESVFRFLSYCVMLERQEKWFAVYFAFEKEKATQWGNVKTAWLLRTCILYFNSFSIVHNQLTMSAEESAASTEAKVNSYWEELKAQLLEAIHVVQDESTPPELSNACLNFLLSYYCNVQSVFQVAQVHEELVKAINAHLMLFECPAPSLGVSRFASLSKIFCQFVSNKSSAIGPIIKRVVGLLHSPQLLLGEEVVGELLDMVMSFISANRDQWNEFDLKLLFEVVALSVSPATDARKEEGEGVYFLEKVLINQKYAPRVLKPVLRIFHIVCTIQSPMKRAIKTKLAHSFVPFLYKNYFAMLDEELKINLMKLSVVIISNEFGFAPGSVTSILGMFLFLLPSYDSITIIGVNHE